MYQKNIYVGNLGRDPEMRYTPNGTPVTNFSIAVNRKYTVNEEEREEVIWIRVAAWGRLAEVCNQYLAKGRQVLVEGRLTGDENGNPKTFTRNDGSVGASFEMTASTVQFLGSRGEGGPQDEDVPPEADGDSIPF
jgi:single-strand DNA-binding protein